VTTPKVNTIKRGDARFYVNPETGEKAPGVTSILNMLPKGFLKYWAAKAVSEFAVDNVGSVVDLMIKGNREAAVDMLKRAPDRDVNNAANVGTEVHDIFERMASGETISRVHPDFKPYVAHFEEFLDEFQPEFVHLEETVWSEAHDYAGSFDALAKIRGELVWLDWKTTRSGVHEEVAVQLAAYGHADYIVSADGTRTPLPQADGSGVLHVRPEGWKLVPCRFDESVFKVFLHLREVFRYERELKSSMLGNPLNAGAKPTKRTAAPRKAVAAK
jgi:hypothetical protein